MIHAHPDYLLTGVIACGHCERIYVGVSAVGRGHRYRHCACFTCQRYGKDACPSERIRADTLDAAILDALIAFNADPHLITRAIAVKTQQVSTWGNAAQQAELVRISGHERFLARMAAEVMGPSSKPFEKRPISGDRGRECDPPRRRYGPANESASSLRELSSWAKRRGPRISAIRC